MRVGLTYNLKPEGSQGDRFEEFDSLETVEALECALRACGHDPLRLGWGAEMMARLHAEPVDAVFNFAEGIGGRGRESQVPALLEMLGIPYTASDALAIGLTLDKAMAKLVAKAHGIATAPWTLCATRDPRPATLRYPLFVKPANEGSSMGISAKSICRTDDELRGASDAIVDRYGPALVEEFLPGEEYTAGIIGGEVIGVMQVVPKRSEPDFVYSLEVKREYLERVEYKLIDARDVADVALAVWRAFNLRDLARVDVRRDRDGVANFVEVNPLPGLNPVTSDLVILARLAGIEHEELIARVMQAAEARW